MALIARPSDLAWWWQRQFVSMVPIASVVCFYRPECEHARRLDSQRELPTQGWVLYS